MNTPHKHLPIRQSGERPYMGPIGYLVENPAARGCVTVTEECACGAVRSVNVNGRHREFGPWMLSSGERCEQ